MFLSGSFDLLDHRIGRADADIRLAVDHRLDRQLLLGEGSNLIIHAPVLGALHGHRESEGFDRYDIAERNAHFLGGIGRHGEGKQHGG